MTAPECKIKTLNNITACFKAFWLPYAYPMIQHRPTYLASVYNLIHSNSGHLVR